MERRTPHRPKPLGAGGAQPVAVNAHGDVLIQTQTAGQDAVGLRLLRHGKTIRIAAPRGGVLLRLRG